ncbi:MAG: iron-only hydrogenase system regulator [Sporomusaceae bacterium]|jgi:putative iron-only hydrogenase system regulator|nr:iron-only hydrogenase system regulator [Sporomusaceae bacterium]
MSRRIGVVGIVIENPRPVAEKINAVLSEYSHVITGRMGIPRYEENVSVIALIIEGTTDEVGAMTGKLGSLPGIIVKSALTKKVTHKGEGSND